MSLTDSEFASLRQTIALRGTVRMALLPLTVFGWAALVQQILIADPVPAVSLYPLAVLVAGFEAIHALHVGAERIGRYIQVYCEGPDGPQWETTAMKVGPALPGGGIDPLFAAVFILTTLANLLPALVAQATTKELAVLVPVHAAFAYRVVRARGAAARQRAVELESFRAVRTQAATQTPTR